MWKLVYACLLGAWLLQTTVAGTQPPPLTTTAAELRQVASSLQMYVDELPDMPKIYGYTMKDGVPQPAYVNVGMYEKKWKFHRDLPETTVFAYGASRNEATVPGPTIEALQNVPTYLTWENHLPESHILPWDPTVPTAIPKSGGVPTVVHLHGGIHDPQSDGNANAWFTADFKETGPAWTQRVYTYLNAQQLPGNIWYHDHALGLTRVNLLAGLIAPYLIRNATVEDELNLPCGEFDRVLMVFDRSFSRDGSLYMNRTGNYPKIHPQWNPEYFGDAIVVNGKAWPFMKVQRRKYRFRIINSANARYFSLSLNNGLPFIQVASDYSYLPKPVTVKSIVIGPAESADFIIDFSSSYGDVLLTNDAPYPYPAGAQVDSLNSKVMKFVIQSADNYNDESPKDESSIPSRLVKYLKPSTSTALKTRYISLHEYQKDNKTTHLYINGKRLEDPATETPVPGSSEIWKVINLTPDDHPLHLHLAPVHPIEQRKLVNVQQLTACMNANADPERCNVNSYARGAIIPIPPNEMTWKNVVKIAPGNMATLLVRFGFVHKNDAYPFDATAEPGYLYHCHILDHEDNAMIRPLKLVWN